MEVIRGIHNIQPQHQGCVATIGNFDGVHLGHQTILNTLRQKADSYDLPMLVITFEPHPQEFFLQDKAPKRLMRLKDKLRFLQQFGVDRVLAINFNQKLSEQSAPSFIKDILCKKLGIRYLLVGDDFRFGHQRQGDYTLLKQLAPSLNYDVEHTPTITIENKRVSSSLVRNVLSQNNCRHAAQLLGRAYTITGKVVRGDHRGTGWGFPTANIDLQFRPPPLQGIFAVTLQIEHNLTTYHGAASLGTRPTVNGQHLCLEVFIFNFNENLYGKRLDVAFIEYLHEERQYESIEALKAAIADDVAKAQAILDVSDV